MEATVHAIVLILAAVIGSALIWKNRGTATAPRLLFHRSLMGLGAFVLIQAVAPLPFLCMCGPGNNPGIQATLPALIGGLFFMTAYDLRGKMIVVAGALIAGLGLSWHFNSLVLPPDKSVCRYTGADDQFISNSCSRPAVAVPEWHTGFTGIFALTTRQE